MKSYLKIFAAIGLFISSFSIFAAESHYAIFVDAGSSGSRLHIYQYDGASAMPVLTDIVPADLKAAKPGLASYADQPQASGASLKPIFDSAVKILPNDIDPKSIKVYVMGTAGMRLIPDAKQQAIYANVTQYLKDNYQFAVGDVETIPGKMEGFYGWLDVNYLANNFQNHQPTIGSIDMGGASTQIAYEIHEFNKTNADDEISVEINHQNYTLFSKCFLGLGQDQARATITADAAAKACYPQGFAFNPPSVGEFNFATCAGIYQNLIQKHSVREQILPIKGQTFIAYSGVAYTYQFFNLDKTFDKSIVVSTIDKACNESWDQLQKEHPGDKYASTYCANGVYQTQLLYSTYGIQGYLLTVSNQINQKDIDWTLGAMLYSLVGNK